METEKVFDAVIIGGGPAGYSAAVRLAQLGGNVCIVEQETLGGTCSRVGCIPTKSLLTKAAFFAAMNNFVKNIVQRERLPIIFSALRESAEQAVQKSRQAAEHLLKQYRVPIIAGKARIRSFSAIDIETNNREKETLCTKQIIIATGSFPIKLKNTQVSQRVITSDQVLQLFGSNHPFPKSLIIVGGGYIGLEFASLFQLLGSSVTMIETMPQLLMREDPEVSSFLIKNIAAQGIVVRCDETVQEISESGTQVTVKTRRNSQPADKEYIADLALLAMGRAPHIDAEELQRLGIDFTARGITTDAGMRTGVRSIFAAGDVAGKYQLAHVAAEEGKIAAENCLGMDSKMDYSAIPRCIFTHPEIASVGKQTTMQGKSFFISNGKALVSESRQGFVKVYFENKKMVGATIVGEQASELIATASTLLGRDLSEIKKLIFAHPTRAEAIGEALRDVKNR